MRICVDQNRLRLLLDEIARRGGSRQQPRMKRQSSVFLTERRQSSLLLSQFRVTSGVSQQTPVADHRVHAEIKEQPGDQRRRDVRADSQQQDQLHLAILAITKPRFGTRSQMRHQA